MKSNGSQRSRALVITEIATHPNERSLTGMEAYLHLPHAEVCRSVLSFRHRGWVEKTDGTIGEQSQRRLAGYITLSPFWDDFDKVVEVTKNLPPNDEYLYNEALTFCSEMELHPPGSLERDTYEAGYLGRAAILGRRHDLNGPVGWFTGTHGWASLISIEALAPERPQA